MDADEAVEILLIEDNPMDAELAIRALKKRHLANNLVWVKDGSEALAFLFGGDQEPVRRVSHHPRIILLDLKLPKVDGHEVLRRIKTHPALKCTPVIVMTSSREEQDIVRSYEQGVNSYIVKPVNFDNFSEAVAQLGMYWVLLNQPPDISAGD